MRRALGPVIVVVLLVACGGDEGADPAPEASPVTSAGPAATAGPGGASVVPSALDFEAPLLDGTTFDARQYAGETVVFWFWAPF